MRDRYEVLCLCARFDRARASRSKRIDRSLVAGSPISLVDRLRAIHLPRTRFRARARAHTLPPVQKRDLRELPDCPRSASRPPPKESESWYTQELNMIAKVNWLTVRTDRGGKHLPRSRGELYSPSIYRRWNIAGKWQEPQVSSRPVWRNVEARDEDRS